MNILRRKWSTQFGTSHRKWQRFSLKWVSMFRIGVKPTLLIRNKKIDINMLLGLPRLCWSSVSQQGLSNIEGFCQGTTNLGWITFAHISYVGILVWVELKIKNNMSNLTNNKMRFFCCRQLNSLPWHCTLNLACHAFAPIPTTPLLSSLMMAWKYCFRPGGGNCGGIERVRSQFWGVKPDIRPSFGGFLLP